MPKIKKAAGQTATSEKTHPNDTKISKILAILERSNAGLNRFEAEHYGDHCLNSTIAALRAAGHVIYDLWESVPTRFGVTARVKRYFYLRRLAHGEEKQ